METVSLLQIRFALTAKHRRELRTMARDPKFNASLLGYFHKFGGASTGYYVAVKIDTAYHVISGKLPNVDAVNEWCNRKLHKEPSKLRVSTRKGEHPQGGVNVVYQTKGAAR